jgi:hypothetical protein
MASNHQSESATATVPKRSPSLKKTALSGHGPSGRFEFSSEDDRNPHVHAYAAGSFSLSRKQARDKPAA